MANTKISALPSYTGTAADLRWFVMNNSGQTETFKFSGYTSPFIVGGSLNDSVFSTFGTPAVFDSDCIGSVVIGSEAICYDDYAVLIGWRAQSGNDNENRCVAIGADAQATGRFSVGLGMSVRASGYESLALGYNAEPTADAAIAIGHTSRATGVRSITIGKAIQNSSPYGTSINGLSNTLTSTGYYNNIFNGTGNSITGTISGATMLSCFSRTADTNDTTYVENLKGFGYINFGNSNTFTSTSTSAIIGGTGNVFNFATGSTIFAGNSCSIIGGSSYSGIFSGVDNDITATNNSAIIGGSQNYMSGASESGIFAGFQNTNNGSMSAVIGSRACSISSPSAERSAIIASYNSSITGNTDQSFLVGGNNNSIGAGEAFILGGNYSQITGGGNNEIIGSRESTITGGNDVSLISTIKSNSGSYDRVVMLGTSGRTSTTSSATFVENLVVFNYANLDYANDAAAASGGVVLGQIYHTAGALKIRIT